MNNLTKNYLLPSWDLFGQSHRNNDREDIISKCLMIWECLHRQNKVVTEFNNADQVRALLNDPVVTENPQLKELLSHGNKLVKLSDRLLMGLFQLLTKIPPLNHDDICEFISFYCKGNREFLDFSPTCMKLMRNLIGKEHKEIYATSYTTPSILPLLLNKDTKIIYEDMSSANLSLMVKFLLQDKIQVSYNDAVEDPKFLDQKFPVGVSFSELGIRIGMEYSKYSRFPIQSRRVEVFIIEHLLEQCSERVFATISPNFLFSELDKPFRKYLIQNGLLESIIFLPAGTLLNSSIPIALLILDPTGNQKSVRFVDVEKAGYFSSGGRIRNGTIENIDELVDKINSSDTFEGIENIPNEKIIEKDYNLTAQCYSLSQKEKEFNSFIQDRETVPLSKLVNFERSLPLRAESGYVQLYEITANDLNDAYIYAPEKQISVSEKIVDDYEANFLQPNDIVLIVKGSVGKVGIVPHDVPHSGEGGWVAGQSALVLRMKKNSPISARELFVFLRSKIGQKLISQNNFGSVINTISLKDLKQLEIIVPTKEESALAEQIFEEDKQTQEQILKLKQSYKDRYLKLWYFE